jgi:hypothetical protein
MDWPLIRTLKIVFFHSSSFRGGEIIGAGLPELIMLMISVINEAPVPCCGLSKSGNGTRPVNKGRKHRVSKIAIVLALLAPSVKGKSVKGSKTSDIARLS